MRKCREPNLDLYLDAFSQQINSAPTPRGSHKIPQSLAFVFNNWWFFFRISKYNYSEKLIFVNFKLIVNLQITNLCWAVNKTSANSQSKASARCCPCPHPLGSGSHRKVVIFSEHSSLALHATHLIDLPSVMTFHAWLIHFQYRNLL